MKKLLLLFFLWVPVLLWAETPLYFASQPSLSPDGQQIYFCYDGGIWNVPVSGGTAARMTAMRGYQADPRVSPDGKWLAFSANEQGNYNVYVTPVQGGEIKQLTFHQSTDRVSGWAADSKYVYFESFRNGLRTTFRVGVDGGTPELMFAGHFNTITGLTENPVDGTFYFNNASESYNYPTRKGYKGENAPQILSWNPKGKRYKEITTSPGKDLWPSVDQKGNLYWASDEKNGEYNLVRFEGGQIRTLTEFTTGIHTPVVSNNGERVVFVKDYRIHLYDVATGKTSIPEIKLYESASFDNPLMLSVEGNISSCDISPDGKKLAFVSRGRLFVSDTKGLFVKEIETDPSERVMEPVWAKDNQTIYYLRSRKGWFNIYKTDAESGSKETLVHGPDNMISTLTVSNDRSMIAFITGNDRIELLHMENDRVEKLSNNEFWSFQSQSISFSADDTRLAYTAMHLFDRDVFVCDLKTKEVINLTNTASYENYPAWSGDGKYLYLVANRFKASFPRGASGNLFRIKLDNDPKPYETEKFNALFKTDSTKNGGKGEIKIDLKDIHRRWERVQSGNGVQGTTYTYKIGNKNYLVYYSNHEGAGAFYVQELLDFGQKPAKKITGLTSASMAYNGKNLYAVQRGDIYSVDLDKATVQKVDIKHRFPRANSKELEQMFYEVWALLSENFYDQHYHGVDWNQKKEYYASLLPYAKTRRDVVALTNDMLGELNASHLGFSSSGVEERALTSMRSIETGIRFKNDAPYKVEGLLKGSPAYSLEGTIRPGDELVAVNGRRVDTSVNREAYFNTVALPNDVSLTFRRGGKEYDVLVHTTTPSNIASLNYTAWEDACKERVDQKTKGRVAYVHMRDMGSGSLDQFLIDMHTEAVHKDALIFDLRFNNGGNVHHEVLEFLGRRTHFELKHRHYDGHSNPNYSPKDKPIVVLINERSLSDAEVTSNGIRSLGLGKLIGTETYRWVIFTSEKRLVDGSNCRLPAWGVYTTKGVDLELTGVAPDIYVRNTFVDRLNGDDPQLDRAIEEILKEL